MRWLPAGLPEWGNLLARAIDRQFLPRIPVFPVRVPPHPETDLTAEFAAANPYGLAINTDTKKLVISVLNAGATAFEWANVDASAL